MYFSNFYTFSRNHLILWSMVYEIVLVFLFWSTWTFDWPPMYLRWTNVDILLTIYLPHLVHVIFGWPPSQINMDPFEKSCKWSSCKPRTPCTYLSAKLGDIQISFLFSMVQMRFELMDHVLQPDRPSEKYKTQLIFLVENIVHDTFFRVEFTKNIGNLDDRKILGLE